MIVAEEAGRITLADAFRRYGVPIPTLRYWLDKGLLRREYDYRRRVVIDEEQLKKVLEGWGKR